MWWEGWLQEDHDFAHGSRSFTKYFESFFSDYKSNMNILLKIRKRRKKREKKSPIILTLVIASINITVLVIGGSS